MRRFRSTPLAAAALTIALLTAACGGANDTETSSSDAPTATSAEASSTSSSTTAETASPTKVNANTASVSELTAAFDAAGISNAGRWAKEVEEYRPYPTTDPSFAKLQQNLAKYNPGDDVVKAIISTLAL